jgi:predicted ATPase/DNA-binding winged helix-turn-helix (wHTH) protein
MTQMTETIHDGVAKPPRSYRFGPYVFVPQRSLLLRSETPVRIGGRALDLLEALVERPGTVIGKRELIARAWPKLTVDEGNLKANMAALRRALDGGTPADRYIATVTGRGYRFVASVQSSGTTAPERAKTTIGTRSHNLPTGITRIIGRADAIDALQADLCRARLVSIVGAGGIGKTTVALAVAERALQCFKDGVWLVDLASLRDPGLVPSAVAKAMGLAANSAKMLSRVCEYLRHREMLIVLDNCEHVIDAAAACASSVLTSAAAVKLLVTSREPLVVKGERVRRLSALSMPPLTAQLSAEEALTFPAVQLFVDRATDRLESFSLTDADAPLVADICRKLDGLALAIEIAATRVDAFGIGELSKLLDDQFRIIIGHRAGLERHRTLTATLDWSCGLLSDNDGALLRAVSVFAGVFDTDGASFVAGASSDQTADALAQLAAKSLLTVDIDADGPAYRLLETTRAYCLERLRAWGEDQIVSERHAEFVCTSLEAAKAEWSQKSPREWGIAYGRFLDDLRGALTWASRDRAHQMLRIRLTIAGIPLWNYFSLAEEGWVQVSRVVEEIETAGLSGTAAEMELKVWLGGATVYTRGLMPQALEALRRALDIAVKRGDMAYRLRCLRMIGIYQHFTGEHRAASDTLQAFASASAMTDASAVPEGETLVSVGEFYFGELDTARRRLERLHEQSVEDVDGTRTLRYLANVVIDAGALLSQSQWLTGSPDTASRTAAAAVELGLETNHHFSLTNALSHAFPVAYWNGQNDDAARYVAMLEEQVIRHGMVARRPVLILFRAVLACTLDDTSASLVDELKRAIAELRAIRHLARMPYYLSILADALTTRGHLDEAEQTIANAIECASAQGEKWCVPELLRVQASVFSARGRADEAEKLLIDSIARASEIHAVSWQLRSANHLACLLNTQSRWNEARQLLKPLFASFTEGHRTSDLVIAASLLDRNHAHAQPRKRAAGRP